MAPPRDGWYGLLIPDADGRAFLRDVRVVASVIGAMALAAMPAFLLERWSGLWACVALFLVCLAAVIVVGGLERRLARRRSGPGAPVAPEPSAAEPAGVAGTEAPAEPAGGAPPAARGTTARPAEPAAAADRRVWRSEVRGGIGIAVGIVVVAFVLAAWLFGWEWLGFGVFFFFAYLLLFGAPYWLAALQETADDQRERSSGESP